MSIGFKEWALVCRALENGDSSLIIRKGGIAEGRDGFRFKHADFFLFPTLFHEQQEKTTLPAGTPLPVAEPGTIVIRSRATVEWTRLVTDLEVLSRLAPFHILHPNVVRERFHYDETPGVHVAFLRVQRLDSPWTFPDAPRFGGCRSWLDLPEPPADARAEMVLSDAQHAERSNALQAVLDAR